MGFLDKPFGGLFDFNRDGKEDLGELWIAHKIFEDVTKTEDEEDDDIFVSDDDYEDHSWRQFCEDGIEFGIDPEDYETEEEYEEAVEDARAEEDAINIPISITIGENTDYNEKEIKESDYPNKRRYNAAVILYKRRIIYANREYETEEKNRCRFILEQSDEIIAANYLTADGDFLFSQAIKDNFDIPVTLPDEDETSEFSLPEILKKIQRKNVPLALNIWEWCVEQFLPYADYSVCGRKSMTNGMLDNLYDFTDKFQRAFREYLNDRADFRTKLIREADEVPSSLDELIVNMIKDGYNETAAAMFGDGLFKADGKWKQVNNLMDGLIFFAKNYEELETIEFVEMNLLPRITQYTDGMILDEVEGWQQEITEYKKDVERRSEKYAFSRSNAWRNTVPDGSEYGLDPRYYDTEQEYSDALLKAKYAWRDWAAQRNTLGLDPEDYETEKEYDEAWRLRYDERQRQKREEQAGRRQLLQQEREAKMVEQRKRLEAELLNDKTIYTYCGVMLPFSEKPYSFRTDDSSLKIGDTVIVPVGEENKEMEGTVVSIGRYARIGVPYPPEKTKFILRKQENDTDGNGKI